MQTSLKHLLLSLTLLSSLAEAKKVVLYMDHATSPMMQQLMHFSEHSQEKDTAFGFAFRRLNIEPKLVAHLPDHYISPLTELKEIPDKPFREYLSKLQDKYPEGLEVEIHANLNFSWNTIRDILRQSKHENLKSSPINITKLYLYDDGSLEYEQFEKLHNIDLGKELLEQEASLKNFIEDKTIIQLSKDNIYLLNHIYPSFFPTTYIYLRPDYIEQEAFLQPLRDFYQKHNATITSTDPKRFSQLTPEQQDFYLKLINTDRAILNDFTDKQPNYVFIGTNQNAFEPADIQLAAKHQANLLKHYVDPKGKFYVGDNVKVFYKGHPAAKEINQIVMEKVPNVTEIPAHVSFGTLVMLNADIDYVMGMQSTIFLSLSKEQVGEQFFTDKFGKTREELFNAPLVKIFQKLNHLPEEKIQKVEDLPMLVD